VGDRFQLARFSALTRDGVAEARSWLDAWLRSEGDEIKGAPGAGFRGTHPGR
jgi:hypothetical protein